MTQSSPPRDGIFTMPLPPEGEPPHDVWLRPLPADEFEALLQQGLESVRGPEGEAMAALRAWFIRKYPTPTERIMYIRRKTKALTQK
jgi:hypothetical protein